MHNTVRHARKPSAGGIAVGRRPALGHTRLLAVGRPARAREPAGVDAVGGRQLGHLHGARAHVHAHGAAEDLSARGGHAAWRPARARACPAHMHSRPGLPWSHPVTARPGGGPRSAGREYALRSHLLSAPRASAAHT